jgi:hypothetical protein
MRNIPLNPCINHLRRRPFLERDLLALPWASSVSSLLLLAQLLLTMHGLTPDPRNRHTTPDERASYISQVDGFCSAALARSSSLGPLPPPSDLEANGRYYLAINQVLYPLLQSWISVPAPELDAEDLIRPMLDSFESIGRMNDEYGKILIRGGLLDPEQVASLRSEQRRFRQITRAYGFRVCPTLF